MSKGKPSKTSSKPAVMTPGAMPPDKAMATTTPKLAPFPKLKGKS